jgi:flagellar biosynthesis protein FlhG
MRAEPGGPSAPQGFNVALLARDAARGRGSDEARRLAKSLRRAGQAAGRHRHRRWRTGRDGSFPVPIMADSEIVVQVSTSATSITNAYALIKRLAQELGAVPSASWSPALPRPRRRWYTIICRQRQAVTLP